MTNHIPGYFKATHRLEVALIEEGHSKPEASEVNGNSGAWDSLHTDLEVVCWKEGSSEKCSKYALKEEIIKVYNLGGFEHNALLMSSDGTQAILTDFDCVHTIHQIDDPKSILVRRQLSIVELIARPPYQELPLMEFLRINERKGRSVNNACLLIRSMKQIGYDHTQLEEFVKAIPEDLISPMWGFR